MVVAYVLLKANTGEADRLREAVAAVDGVVAAHIVAGDIDLVATLEVETPGTVKEIAADEFHAIDGIESTETYIGMD